MKYFIISSVLALAFASKAEAYDWTTILKCADGQITIQADLHPSAAKYGDAGVRDLIIEIKVPKILSQLKHGTLYGWSEGFRGDSIPQNFYGGYFQTWASDNLGKLKIYRTNNDSFEKFHLVIFRDFEQECVRYELLNNPYDGWQRECVEWKTLPQVIKFESDIICVD